MMKRYMLSVVMLLVVCTIGAVTIRDFEVHFIDVGQADSTLIVDSGKTMLIDAGNNADGRLVIHYLKSMGIDHIDILVGTHPHEDHIGGMDAVIDEFSVSTLLMPAKIHTTGSFEDLLDAIDRNRLSITVPKVNDTFTLGKSEITVIAPVRTDYFSINDHSLVLQLVRDGKRFLFEADAESTSEWHMIGNKADLASDVLKVAHHGSDTSTNSTFINMVNPSISVIHVGKDNPYGHPSYTVMNRIGNTIYRTDQEGTVTITIEQGSIMVRTARVHGNEYWKGITLIGDTSTKMFHMPGCSLLPTEARKEGMFEREDALSLGYRACSICKP